MFVAKEPSKERMFLCLVYKRFNVTVQWLCVEGSLGVGAYRLMMRHGVGCRIEETPYIKKVDQEFFE